MSVPKLMTDRDLAKWLGRSRSFISEHLRADYQPKPGEIDLREANPVILGCRRYWLAEDVEKLFRGRAPSAT